MTDVYLSVDDPSAQDLLWEYAQRRRFADPTFATDLVDELLRAGFTDPRARPAVSDPAERLG
jgi:hypothetical protein